VIGFIKKEQGEAAPREFSVLNNTASSDTIIDESTEDAEVKKSFFDKFKF